MPAELAATLTATDADRLLQAEAVVRGYCGWHIAPERTDVEYVAPDYSPHLLLPSLYVTAVAVVDPDSVTIETDTYTWTPNGVVTRIGSWWDRGTIVTYTHGYSAAPAEVTAVVQAVAQRAVGNPGSASKQTAGPFSVELASAAAMSLLDAEKAILDRYKLPPRP